MYAVISNGSVLPGRYPSWDDAVEAAQEELSLSPSGDWSVVVMTGSGNFVPAPVFGV